MHCVFLNGAIPDQNLARAVTYAAVVMLAQKERSIRFTLDADDAVAGEGGVTTRGEFVGFGTFFGIRCDVVVEVGAQRHAAAFLVRPGATPEDISSAHLAWVPPAYFFPKDASPIPEA